MLGLVRMIETFFSAVLKAGIPVALASYGLIWWALKNDYLESVFSVKELEKEVKRQTKDKEAKLKADRVHSKWLAFGGGFYGVVGLLTYAVVELGEIRDFFLQFEGIGAFISNISIEMFIGLFIEAFMNFVIAIAWPIYWLTEIRGGHVWIWFGMAYGGYWSGTRLALRQLADRDDYPES